MLLISRTMSASRPTLPSAGIGGGSDGNGGAAAACFSAAAAVHVLRVAFRDARDAGSG